MAFEELTVEDLRWRLRCSWRNFTRVGCARKPPFWEFQARKRFRALVEKLQDEIRQELRYRGQGRNPRRNPIPGDKLRTSNEIYEVEAVGPDHVRYTVHYMFFGRVRATLAEWRAEVKDAEVDRFGEEAV